MSRNKTIVVTGSPDKERRAVGSCAERHQTRWRYLIGRIVTAAKRPHTRVLGVRRRTPQIQYGTLPIRTVGVPTLALSWIHHQASERRAYMYSPPPRVSARLLLFSSSLCLSHCFNESNSWSLSSMHLLQHSADVVFTLAQVLSIPA